MLWGRAYNFFFSLSKKTRKSNHLQMSLQRQHFVLSYLKTLNVGTPRVEPVTSYSADQHTPNWANQVAVYYSHMKNKIGSKRRILLIYHIEEEAILLYKPLQWL